MFGFLNVFNSKKDKLLRATLRNILGFKPGNIFLYKLAFRHRSVSKILHNGNKQNNERLEYLGDSVLSTVVAHYLFMKYPSQDEGFMTEMRSKMVSRVTLNKIGIKMGLHNLIRLDTNQFHGFKSVDGDVLEALIGAVFLDKGFNFASKVILNRIIAVHMDLDALEHRDWNYKSKLIDWGQKEKQKVSFQVLDTILRGKKKLYKIAVLIDGIERSQAMDHSIKSAEQLAAEIAYKDYVAKECSRKKQRDAHKEVFEENDNINSVEVIKKNSSGVKNKDVFFTAAFDVFLFQKHFMGDIKGSSK